MNREFGSQSNPVERTRRFAIGALQSFVWCFALAFFLICLSMLAALEQQWFGISGNIRAAMGFPSAHAGPDWAAIAWISGPPLGLAILGLWAYLRYRSTLANTT
jgi:hypothetical protein